MMLFSSFRRAALTGRVLSLKAIPHNTGAQIAQSEFSPDCLKIPGNTSCIG